MKKIVTVTEVEGEGLEALLGQVVTVFCQIYIYTGKLVGVNKTFIKLEDASVVFDTGSFSDKAWATAERLPEKHWYIKANAIESFGILK